MSRLKLNLFQICRDKIISKTDALEAAIEEAKLSAQQETKSSVGDKYETGRAMMHLEIEKYTVQLFQWKKILEDLNKIDLQLSSSFIMKGSLIHTDQGNYFISVALGKIILDGSTYYAVSDESPVGKILIGKKKSDKIEFNQKFISILEIE
jgi:hypothetical protein